MEGVNKVWLLFVILVPSVTSHMCLITPRQRGTTDIFQSGSPTCFRHTPPCGGVAPETPDISRTYRTGQTAFFTFHQNLNHYEPGYPGFMDISIANSTTSTDFQTLAVITDTYVHAQDHQQNYTVLVKIPEIECDHCVIRARYDAHKPGEPTFLQCSDIKIAKSKSTDTTLRFKQTEHPPKSKSLLPVRRALRLQKKYPTKQKDSNTLLYGFAFNPFVSTETQAVSIDTTSGKIKTINRLMFSIDAYGSKTTDGYLGFMVDEVVGIDNYRNTSSVLLHTAGGTNDVAKRLYTIGSTNGTLVQETDLFQYNGSAINALSWYVGESMAAIRLQTKQGGWDFEVGTVDKGGSFTVRANLPKPEGLYVNFQWLETDVNNHHMVYHTVQPAASKTDESRRRQIRQLMSGARKYVGQVELDVSAFTFMSMHSYKGSSNLYAFSPGLWDAEQHSWFLVAINPQTGTVTKQCDIAPMGIFERYYGGSVYQGYSKEAQLLYHVLRVAGSDVDFIVSVNPMTCDLTFSEATNLRHVHSIQNPRPGETYY